jgi:ATP-dependent DNA helicase RecG
VPRSTTGDSAVLGFDIGRIVEDLRRLGSDHQAVEAKSAAGGMPRSIASTISAFANTPGGGTIVLGLDESTGFKPTKLAQPAALVGGLASIARQGVDPPVQASIDEVPFEGQRLVVARITEMDLTLKPCRVAGTRKAYLRVGDGDYELSQLEEDAFVVARSRRRFDEDPIPGTGIADLDADRLNEFLANARAAVPTLRRFDDMKVLLKTGVLTTEGVVTVAGLIALGEYPQQYLPAVSVRAALLPAGRTIGNVRVLDDATFNGSIASIVEDTVAWVTKNSRNEIVEDRLAGRVFDQTWPPLAAVRELVANAVVHRDLAPWSGGRAIELRMSAENFRITNPGGLYEVSVTALGRIDLTSARNRRLIDLCRYVQTTDGRVVEALATGIPTVFAELTKAGLPAPRFFDNGISFTAIIDTHRDEITPATPTRITEITDVPPALQALLDVLANSSADVNEISHRLGATTASVAKRLQRLKRLGLIVSDGGSGRHTTYHRSGQTRIDTTGAV